VQVRNSDQQYIKNIAKHMIIGNGDVAKVLTDRHGLIFFASGVSNSSETRQSEFQREIDLLLKQDPSYRLVYFSSLCVFYSDTPYAKHKKNIEDLVKNNFPRYTIMRLGNIDWGINPHTIFNSLRNKIKNNEPFEIQDTYRYIVSRKEFDHWIGLIPDWNSEMNITGKLLSVQEIADQIRREQKRDTP